MEKSNFEKLYQKDVSEKVQKKEGLTYLSWSWAWAEFLKVYPEAQYEIVKNENYLPYFMDSSGAIVYTRVTAGGLTHEMWLPVLDYANKPMKKEPYKYTVYNKKKGQFEERTCKAIDSFAINKAVMRCLVKNLAMFGLGLYIYTGEDLPEKDETEMPASANQLQHLYKIAEKQEISAEDMKQKIFEKFAVSTSKELTSGQITDLINELEGKNETDK